MSNASGEILLVEDTLASLRLLSELLSKAGYSVRQAQDGAMALATVHTRVPDLILLDVTMPGIDGFAVCEALKSDDRYRHIPVIFCSALNDTEHKVRGFSSGAVDFITKPYQPEEVLMRVSTHLELSRLRMALELRVAERTAELEQVANSLRQEVDARRKLEHELRLSSKAFDASYSGIMITNHQGEILAVNPAFIRITGYSKREVLGQSHRLLQPEKEQKSLDQKIRLVLDSSGTWSGELWVRCKNGKEIQVMETIHMLKEQENQQAYYVVTLVDLTESKDAQNLIDFLSYRDSLTGLANRLVARKQLEQLILNADKSGKKVAVLSLDLDRFKVINDSLGHALGDQILKAVAERIERRWGEQFVLSREGGDEFLMIANDIETSEQAAQLAQSLVEEVNQEYQVGRHRLTITTSVGVALYPDDGGTFGDLLVCAENALYCGKKKGGNDYCLFTMQMDSEAKKRMELENFLRGAVTNKQFQLVYQPKVSVADGSIVGAEALVRWNSPDLGFVSPLDFIPLAEETGLILSIDEWVVTSVCQQIRQWQDQGFDTIKVSVNLSALQFRRGDLNALIRRVLDESGVDATCLDLEITEGVLMENLQQAIPILEGFKDIGVSVSLDDFGTGYSSLSYLQKLPIDTLKIDKSFVDEVHLKSSDAVISRTIIALGHNLGINVIAEGVECKEQYDFLAQHGCNEIQGYYFSKPLPASEFEHLYRESSGCLSLG